MKAHAPEGVTVGFGAGGQGPFTTAVLLRGEGFLLDMLDQPALAHRFLQTLTESSIRQRELAREVTGDTSPVSSIGYTDDYGGLVGPELFAEFDLPYLEQVADHFGATHRTIHAELLHQPHLVLLQDHGWEYIDVGTDPHLTIRQCREVLHVPFRVDFDNTGIMLLGTPEQVRQRYREMVAEGALEMNVDLCRGHRDQNIAAFVEVARECE
jgi:uroporphyrinogen-III decarboxylase